MFKRLIVVVVCLAGVCGVFAQGKEEELTQRHHDYLLRSSQAGSGTADITQEVAVFPQLGHRTGNK